jgi:hypothetical protein
MLAFLYLEVAKFPCLICFSQSGVQSDDNPLEKIASFIMNQVIPKKREFHCSNPGPNVP